MVRTLLIRGMLVGLLAGLLAFAVARVFGEPLVDRAIGFETALDHAKPEPGHHHESGPAHIHDAEEPDPVSRGNQAGWGLFTGVTVYATAFGGLFALVFAAVNGRIATLPPRAVAALLAGCGFVAVYLVPNLKYPANPPAVGDADTIGQRTALYFIMLALSVGAMALALILRRRLAARHGNWNAAVIAGGAYLLAVTAAALVLPGINEVPDGFPATVLWQFRIVALGMQLVIWTTIGLGFGAVAEAAFENSPGRARLVRPAGATG